MFFFQVESNFTPWTKQRFIKCSFIKKMVYIFNTLMQSANSTSKKLKNYPNMQNIQRFYKNYCKWTERNQSKRLFNLWCQDTQRQKNIKSPE